MCARVGQATRLTASIQLPVQTWMSVPPEMEVVNNCVSIFLEVKETCKIYGKVQGLPSSQKFYLRTHIIKMIV